MGYRLDSFLNGMKYWQPPRHNVYEYLGIEIFAMVLAYGVSMLLSWWWATGGK